MYMNMIYIFKWHDSSFFQMFAQQLDLERIKVSESLRMLFIEDVGAKMLGTGGMLPDSLTQP